jgi:hypothetical protein
MRPLVNPFMPTPLGSAYYLPNPSTGKAVEFDDCEQKPAPWSITRTDIGTC